MLKRRLARWNVSRYIRERDLPEVLQRINNPEEHQTGAATIEINGRHHGVTSLMRAWRRHGARRTDLPALSSAPGLPSPPSSVLTAPNSQADAVFERQDEKRDSYSREPVVEELTAACVATLQTDYHLAETDAAAKQPSKIPVDGSPLEHKIRGYLLVMHRLRDPQELRELHQVVQETDIYYQWMQDERKNSVLRPFECSTNEEGRARDFYGRYWLGLLLSVGDSVMLGNAMLEQAFDQVRASIDEHHPHFLTWICFVICYEGNGIQNGPIDNRVANRALTFAYETSKGSMEDSDPRLNIQKVLNASTRRHDLALSLLRQVVDKFRADTNDEYLEPIQLLGQLFEHLEHSSGQEIDQTLQRWAKVSQSLAQLIHADRGLRCRL